MERNMTHPGGDTDVAQLLGISEEMASACLARGHITLTSDTRQTFMRLRDLYQVLRQTTGSRRPPARA